MSDVTSPAAEPKVPSARPWKIALMVSLALNLLILGTVAGTMYGVKRHFPGHGGTREDFGLMGLTRFLPEDRRKDLRKDLRENREKLRPMIEEIRTLRRGAADLLAAEPFDRAALEGAIAKVAEKELALRQTAVTTFLGHAERLEPSERKILADWWRKKSETYHRRGMRGKGARKTQTDEAAPKN